MDISLVNHYPHQQHKNSNLMSATARLKVEVSELHAGENGHLEMSCRATIPEFIMQHEQFADIRNKTVKGKFSSWNGSIRDILLARTTCTIVDQIVNFHRKYAETRNFVK